MKPIEQVMPGEARAAPGAGGATVAPGTAGLFFGFLSIGITGFGGVLPFARRMMVERRRWLTAAEFTDVLALCQFLPGPNIVNMAVALGSRFRGATGAAAGVAGLLSAPVAIVIGLGALYGRYGEHQVLARGFGGLAAAASGMILAMACKVGQPLLSRRFGRLRGLAIAVAALVAVALLRLPMLPVLLVLAPASVALHRRVP
jgi:chromate transporter